MGSTNKIIGDLGEELAEKYLLEMGYTIFEKNFRCKTGEIDLIGHDGDFITFIEVKTRRSSTYGSPGEAVNSLKQLKIYKTAEMYIMKKKLFDQSFRFDVVEVLLLNNKPEYSINLIKNAFQL